MPTAEEIRKAFTDNGIDVDSLEQKMQSALSSGQYTEDELKNAVLQQYNSLVSQRTQTSNQQSIPQEQQQLSQGVETPNAAKGILQSIQQGLTGGLAPYIEGVKSTNIGKIAFQAINPIGGLINPPDISGPLWDKQAYEKGKQQFIQERQAFKNEHPILSTAGEIVGTVGGIALTGPVAKGASGVARLAGAGTLGERIAGSAAAFGTYGAERGLANEGQGLSPKRAATEAIKEGTLGAVFPMLTGGTALAEQWALQNLPLISKAAQMTGLAGKAARASVKTGGAALEGALVAQAASGIETAFGQERPLLPSKEEVLAGMLGVGSIRAIGGAAQEGGRIVSQLKQPTTRQLAAPSSKYIEGETRKLLREKAALQGKPYQEQRLEEIEKEVSGLKRGLEPFVETAEKDISAIAEEAGWQKGKPYKATTGSRYVPFSKDGKEVTIRISNHKGKNIPGEIDYNLTKTPEENLTNISDAFAEAENLKAGEKLQTRKGQLESVRVRLEPTEEQINTIKSKAKAPISDEVAREIALGENKEVAIASAEARGKNLLPIGERVRRAVGNVLRKGGETLDTYAPVASTTRLAENLTGQKKPVSERPDFMLRQRDRGGVVQVRQKALIDDFEQEQKADNYFVQKLQSYMEAKKNEDMLPQSISKLKARNKNGKNDAEIARQEAILNRSKETVAAIEASEPRVLAHAQKQWDYAQEQLEELHNIGRVSDSEYNRWKENQHYVRSEANLPEEVKTRSLLGGDEIEQLNRQSGISSAFKKYKGYEGGYNNLVISNLAQGKRVSYLADTQRAMKAWLDDALKIGEASPAKGFSGLKEGQYPVGYNPENQIFVWENGKAKVFDVPRNIAKAFNPTYKEEGFLLKNLRLTNNVFKLGTTGISTGFSLMNLARDIQGVMGGSRSGMYFRPSYVKTAAELYGPGSSKLTGSKKELRDLIDSKLGTEFSLADTQLDLDRTQLNRVNTLLEAQGNANPQGTFIGDTMALLMKVASKAKAPAEKTFQELAKTLSFLGNWSEKIGRTTVFLTELRRQAGSEEAFEAMLRNPKLITKEQANNAAKEMTEVTLDFNRKMNPTIEGANRYAAPYFKPSLLGAERVWKVLTDPEIAPQAWRWIATIGTLQGLIRSEMDEKQRKKYESQFNPEIAAKNISIVARDGTIVTVPANQEFGGLYQWIAAGTEYVARKLKGKEARDAAWKEVYAAAKQIGENAIPGGYLLEPSNLAPTPIGKMILEENINKDIYSKTDIESEAMRRLPVEERFSASTPRIYRLMSKYLKVGKLQSSPKMWEHRAKKLGSSFAKEMADVADVALEYAGIGEEEWTLPKRAEESSIVSRFFNKDYTAYARNVQEYDDEMKELEQAYTSYKKNPKGADEEKKKKAGIYKAIKDQDQQRINLISDNQKILAGLRRKGYSSWQDYLDGKITKEQFRKEKELESANAASKYYSNQKKISDITDKLLYSVRQQKKKKGIR